MNRFKIIERMYIFALLALPLTIAGQSFYIPTSYENFLAKTIASLESKKASLESKIAQTKKRITQTGQKKSDKKTLLNQGNQSVLDLLSAAINDLSQRIKSLKDEKSKLNTLGINSSAQEDLLIKKAQLRLAIDESTQQIHEAQRLEQFFENQKAGKSQKEKDALEKIKRGRVQQKEKLEQKIQRQKFDLQNLK